MSYLSDYNKGNKAGLSKLAFDYLITDLLQKDLTGEDKIRTLTGNNMEGNAPTNFVPSMIYAMMYVSGTPEDKLNGKFFYDAVPVILCLSCDNSSVTGLNFNFMPNEIRCKLLDILSESGFVKKAIDSGTDNFRINQKMGTYLMMGNVSGVIAFLKETTGVDISMCVRKYNRRNIVKSRLIEYDMWQYIPYLNFNDAVRGVQLASVQKSVADTSNK